MPLPPNLGQDPELLRFVDLECFLWSTVNADLTPMINAGMVFCDRHYGGINYPARSFVFLLCSCPARRRFGRWTRLQATALPICPLLRACLLPYPFACAGHLSGPC